MKLEFLSNRTVGRPYQADLSEQLVLLFDFDPAEAGKFRQALQRELIATRKPLDLSCQYYIELINCNLILRISDEETGLTTRDNQLLYCDLTLEKYTEMVALLAPYSEKKTKGYQLLSEESDIDLLLSPGKSW
ncbi:MAG TPA: hypothetical protein VNZ86_19610 [Bacteroidia bacterium]|jgi:hypothetical protein|nr:hypothetical protein [Bacteroidia bacterium]